jgi:hypothetical protein
LNVSDYEDFDEDIELDEVDSEFTPLHNGIDEGILVNRKGFNPDRRMVPAGYFPQWPSYYPEVRQFKAAHLPHAHDFYF